MSWIAFLLTVTGLVLNARKIMACWPVWIIGNLLWIVAYAPAGDWPIVATNAVFLVLNVYGWRRWRRDVVVVED